VRDALRHHWRDILLAAGARLSENSCFYLFSTYVIAYGTDVIGAEQGLMLLAVNIAAAVEFFTIPLYGWLSDAWSRKRMFVLGCLVIIGFAWPYYALLDIGTRAAVVAAVMLSLAGGHAMLYSVQASLIPELFGTRVRYTGASIGYQLTAPLGGLAPLIAAGLVYVFGKEYWPLILYIVLITLLSLGCVSYLAETSRKDLRS
jgi:MFS family permease